MPHRTRDDRRAGERRRYESSTAERRAHGLCVRCGNAPPASGRAKCEPCLEQRRLADRARYAAAKAEGRPYGGRDPEARRGNARARSRRRYEARRAAGTCTHCGQRPPVAGRSRCEPCLVRRNAKERDQWARRCALGLCGKCGRPAGGASRCGACAAAQSCDPRVRRASAQRRYWRRRALSRCTDCGEYAAGASRCEPCARRSWARSAEHRGLPAGPTRYRVLEIATGADHGQWDSLAEVAACLAFANLSPEDVVIESDASLMASLTAWA